MKADGGVSLDNVTVRYGRRVALQALTGEFVAGSLTAVVGANGAGKSTLLAAIAGVVRLAGGVIHRAARQRLAYLPQLASIDRDYPLTVAELITLPGDGPSRAGRSGSGWGGIGGTAEPADCGDFSGRAAAGSVCAPRAAGC